MQAYDSVGLSTWIGEDFDERVLAALEAHHRHVAEGGEGGGVKGGEGGEGAEPPPLLAYSIIVEKGLAVGANLAALAARLGPSSIHWVQLGPPANTTANLAAYRVMRLQVCVWCASGGRVACGGHGGVLPRERRVQPPTLTPN